MDLTMPPAEHPRSAPIENATAVTLATWVQRLDEAGGRDLDHTAIARLLVAEWDVQEWWAQGVTVAYEQLIGRRVVGQSCDGDFSASASRTLPGTMDRVREAWDEFMTADRRQELGLEEPSLTDTATWRYWRAAVQDGTRLSVNITARTTGSENPAAARSTLGIEHKGLETAEARDAWKTTWKRTLDAFVTQQKEKNDR